MKGLHESAEREDHTSSNDEILQFASLVVKPFYNSLSIIV
jgi:hypothetical protein